MTCAGHQSGRWSGLPVSDRRSLSGCGDGGAGQLCHCLLLRAELWRLSTAYHMHFEACRQQGRRASICYVWQAGAYFLEYPMAARDARAKAAARRLRLLLRLLAKAEVCFHVSDGAPFPTGACRKLQSYIISDFTKGKAWWRTSHDLAYNLVTW